MKADHSHKTKSARRICGTVLCIFLFSVNGWPTTVLKMEIPALVNASDSIVQGQVEHVYSEWDPQMKTIFTYISLRVDDALKGENRRTVVIRQLGGSVGGMNLLIAGMPSFTGGEQVIVFLKGNPRGSYDLVGLGQGKYEIINNFAVTHISGVDLVDGKTGRVVGVGVVAKEPVEAFKSRIRRLAQ